METVVAESVGEVEVYRQIARTVYWVVKTSVADCSQEESLMQPEAEGNCINWVLGHLIDVYDKTLLVLEQTPVMGAERTKRYERGAPPLREGSEALEMQELLGAWDEAAKRVDAGLAQLTAERLDEKAPFSPADDPQETVRSLMSKLLFHQAYHAGQLGLLRRLAGKAGVIG